MTPAIDGEFWSALPPPFVELDFDLPCADVVDAGVEPVEAGSVFFVCPGAFAEFHGAGAGDAGCAAGVDWELSLPLPLPPPFPLPLPARAELVNAARAIASTAAPKIPVRLLISFSPRIRMTLPQCLYGLQTTHASVRIRVC